MWKEIIKILKWRSKIIYKYIYVCIIVTHRIWCLTILYTGGIVMQIIVVNIINTEIVSWIISRVNINRIGIH